MFNFFGSNYGVLASYANLFVLSLLVGAFRVFRHVGATLLESFLFIPSLFLPVSLFPFFLELQPPD
jgi:hypothetical protein